MQCSVALDISVDSEALLLPLTDCKQSLGPTYNDPIPQVLATQFDAGGQKCICFSRRICHRGKTVFVQRARSLFVLDSFTHHITCGLVPRRRILPFYGRENIKFIPNLILLSRLLVNGNCGCLSQPRINVTFCNNVSGD